ncbi:hypothetical protein PVAP13_1NG169700 [Panicum virgatum]|uniref:Uncharacterized protein n=1 Tax=Panicum virgatum TaxID=38727 RepID=A0A8T0WYM7_PANVG|nr:hypothetical protein PVAP13_1NG169700 [Panicum virgatum]
MRGRRRRCGEARRRRSGSGGIEGEWGRGQGLRGGATGREGGAGLGIARWRDAAARGGGGGARGGGNEASHGRRRRIGRAAAVMSQGRGRVMAGGEHDAGEGAGHRRRQRMGPVAADRRGGVRRHREVAAGRRRREATQRMGLGSTGPMRPQGREKNDFLVGPTSNSSNNHLLDGLVFGGGLFPNNQL